MVVRDCFWYLRDIASVWYIPRPTDRHALCIVECMCKKRDIYNIFPYYEGSSSFRQLHFGWYQYFFIAAIGGVLL